MKTGGKRKSLWSQRNSINLNETFSTLSRVKWALFSCSLSLLPWWARKGDMVPIRQQLWKYYQQICTRIFIWHDLYRSLTPFWLCRFSMVPQNLFPRALLAMTMRNAMQPICIDSGRIENHNRSHCQHQLKSKKSNNQSNKGTHTRIYCSSIISARIKVCAASTVNRSLRQWFHWTRGHVRARAFLEIGFLLSI